MDVLTASCCVAWDIAFLCRASIGVETSWPVAMRSARSYNLSIRVKLVFDNQVCQAGAA